MTSEISHEEVIRRFEGGAVAEQSFHHADHVRLAFAYLCQHSALEALGKFCDALKMFAVAKGKAQLYHETITYAYFFLIRERMARSQTANWNEFARENSDLLVWKGGILSRHYQEDTLKSELARRVFVFPDRIC